MLRWSSSCCFILMTVLVQSSVGFGLGVGGLFSAGDEATQTLRSENVAGASGGGGGGLIHVLQGLVNQPFVPNTVSRNIGNQFNGGPYGPNMYMQQVPPSGQSPFMRPVPQQQQQILPQHIVSQQAPMYSQPQILQQPPPPLPPQKQLPNGGSSDNLDFEMFGGSNSLFSNDRCGQVRPTVTKFVSGGQPLDNHEQPWYVQIIIHSNEFAESETYCGGTLISPEWVLTAAHCYDDMSADRLARNTHIIFRGLHGIHRKFTAKADQVILHDNYVPAMLSWEAQSQGLKPGPFNDLALVRLRTQDIPAPILRRLVPICLPASHVHVHENTVCKIMGHGFMNGEDEKRFRMPQQLQGANVRIASNEACQNDVESRLIKEKINDRTTCVRGPIQPCVGDSGGPLLCTGTSRRHIDGSDGDEMNMHDDNVLSDSFEPRRWYLIGVTSFAVSTDEHDHCGTFKSAVFGLVSKQLDWIRDIVSKYSPRGPGSGSNFFNKM